jgi:hypothetical protein
MSLYTTSVLVLIFLPLRFAVARARAFFGAAFFLEAAFFFGAAFFLEAAFFFGAAFLFEADFFLGADFLFDVVFFFDPAFFLRIAMTVLLTSRFAG